MAVDRVKFQDIVESQLPRYVREEFPLLVDFLEEYYISQEFQGGTFDLVQNIDKYVKVDELCNLKSSTVLEKDINYTDTSISAAVEGNFTDGFPDFHGIIRIDQEIIEYDYKTDTSFEGCTRGFSGITSYISPNTPDQLVFTQSAIDKHTKGAKIENLNILFLQQFFKKLKKQFVPGFTERNLYSGLDQRNFVFGADTFYKSKGTEESFKILFRALYGEEVEVIKPSKFLLRPSDADYQVTQDLVVEKVQGDPLTLKNRTLYQDSTNSRGTVTNVEKIYYAEGDFYQISVDSGYKRDISDKGSVFGEFKPNSKTQVLNAVAIGATFIDVDSTIGFPESGLLVSYDADGDAVAMAYTGKNSNQFLDVTGVNAIIPEITDIRSDDNSYVKVGAGSSVQVRITSTLKEVDIPDHTYFYNKDDTIRIKSLGLESKIEPSRGWKFNVKTTWDVEFIELIDVSERSYEITTYDTQFLQPGYSVSLIDQDKIPTVGTVSRIISPTKFVVRLSGLIAESKVFTIKNNILKGNSSRYPQLQDFFANIQNTYATFGGDVLVASNSIPNYPNLPTNPYDKVITFSGSSSTDSQTIKLTEVGVDHGFYTGDAIYYQPGVIRATITTPEGISYETTTPSAFDDIKEGVLYVKRIDAQNIKLSNSRADIFEADYLTLAGTVTDNKFIYFDYYKKILEAQQIFREIKSPDHKSGNYETDPGYTGVLINGIEVLNYKSQDFIYYGDIQSINITNGGKGYDIINPPSLVIQDVVGTAATGICAVEGQLERIEILDKGFDYIGTPVVAISGGNPVEDAAAEVNLTPVVHSVEFNAERDASNNGITSSISLSPSPWSGDNSIGFSTFHKFAQNERVMYDPQGSNYVVGLATDAFYYVGILDNFRIKLYNKEEDSIAGINTVELTNYGSGTQLITATTRKRIVTNVVVTNPGQGYKNKKRQISAAGVSTALHQFNISNHGYSTGEIIQYAQGTTGITGLSTSENYYVRKVNNNTFYLNLVGTGNTATQYYYTNDIAVTLTSTGDGNFNYKPISVTINGKVGVGTSSGQDFSAKVQPIFRGSLDSVDLTSAGVGYGASEVIDFNRQPDISFYSGDGALVTPIISNGQITQVLINAGGSNYNSPPNLTLTGDGKYAKLTPIVNNGQLVEVKVISGGVGFTTDKTFITVTKAGLDAVADTTLRTWNINLFERNYEILKDDDGVIEENIHGESLEYGHIYAPRPLRESTYVLSGESEDNTYYGIPDLQIEDGTEAASKFHSPILGWAYDGNPIYGPYGYSDPDGGTIKQLSSGYALQVDETNRPPLTTYKGGFFVEDYNFTERGDLDKHNGRYGITPDYPKGIYAYFATLNTTTIESVGPFTNYKKPAFPYLIGPTYRSKPNIFNFGLDSNQTTYNIQSTEWFRNTLPYHTNDARSTYDYMFNSNEVKEQTVEIKGTSFGTVQNVGIITGGSAYKVSDRLVFDNTDTEGIDASARVERISGKVIDTISTASTVFYNIEFYPTDDRRRFVGWSSITHKLENLDLVNINGLSNYFEGFDGSYNIGIRSDNFVLTLGIGATAVTGMTTYFYVSGALEYPHIRENDILGVSTVGLNTGVGEQLKVLNVDKDTGRVRVLREHGGTVGLAYSSLTQLFEDPRKFTVNVGSLKTTKTFRLNKELYFDPSESVGIGTTTGTGVGTTIAFASPGVGATSVFVKPQQIYLKDHNLQLNDTLYYSANGGTTLQVWSGLATNAYSSLSGYEKLYAAPITSNFLGISTTKVGLGTAGSYVGVNTDSGLLYFTSLGAGVYHSFRTSVDNVITGQVDKNIVTVSTAATHGLRKTLYVADTVWMDVKPTNTKTVTVKYNDYNRRMVFDPQNFVAGDVDTTLNTITFTGHDYERGDKVIHTATTAAGGLVDEKMYYIIPFNGNKIRLVADKFELSQSDPAFVDITSASAGTLSKINPLVEIKRNQKLYFDLSDSSLSFNQNNATYSAYSLDIFSDNDFNNIFLTSGATSTFEVTSSGKPGIDATANVTISISDSVPVNLYYKFRLENLDLIPTIKKELTIDKDVSPFNQINVVKTAYDGKQTITGIGTTTFTFNIAKIPESLTYNSTNAESTYETDSPDPTGSITKIKILDTGNGYKALPGITTLTRVGTTTCGTGAILESQSTNIGSILNTQIERIGFDYPTDNSVRAVANLPEILEMEQLTSFKKVGITSVGRNLVFSPTLVVIDGYTNQVVSDVDLFYNLGDREVTIRKNTTGMYNTTPRIIPTRNSNGVGISSIDYTSATKTVRVWTDATFSAAADFPYNTGSKILIENVSVGIGSTGKGFNSEDYNYTLFEVTNANSVLGASGAWVEYRLTDILSDSDVPGVMDIANSMGRMVSELDFPIYDPQLKTNDYFIGEPVTSGGQYGFVESWNNKLETLKITTGKDFKVGDIVRGNSSDTQAVIKSKIDFNAEIKTGAGATVNDGWQTNTGFLNNSLQKTSNNEYYQNFSYSIKSRVPLQTWDDPVSAMNHTSGFAKYSDLVVESDQADGLVARPDDSNIEIVNDIVGEVSLHQDYDFDYVTEGTIQISVTDISKTIDFENRTLTDFYESVGNRVLSVDDMSSIFNSNPRATKYNSIAKYLSKNQVYNKIFTFAKDTTYTDERQFSIVSLLQIDDASYINEYATLSTYPDLGTYSYQVTASGWDLTFYPVKYEYNNYSTATFNFSTWNNQYVTEDLPLGNVAIAMGQTAEVGAATTTTIVSISSTYRSAKIHALLQDTTGNVGVQELNLCHDGTDVYMVEYGELKNSLGYDSFAGNAGFGTFGASISGANVIVEFHPSVSVALTCNSSIVAIASSATGVGSTAMSTGRITSSYVGIASTSSPTANIVATYDSQESPAEGVDSYSAAYYYVSVEDTTNSEAQCSEVCVINSSSNHALVEFANVETGGSIGTVGISSVGANKNLVFTPVANVATQVRVIGFELQIYNDNAYADKIDLNNVTIETDGGEYKGTQNDVMKAFDLKHNGLGIFRRSFDGSSSVVVNTTDNLLNVADHFFVTGEQLNYSYAGAGTTMTIGITSTSVAGIGTTDKLPNTLYAVAVNDGSLRFSETAAKALQAVPEVFELSSVGIGTSHSITATNANAKAILAIDNMIQSPISGTAVTSALDTGVNFDTTLALTGVTSIFTRDLLKIDDEIVIVDEVAYGGANNLLVRRAQLGTAVKVHSAGAQVTKIVGSYNIVDNTLNFSDAPYGLNPISTTTGNPDNRDWTGIATHSTFQGRTFVRSGVPLSSNPSYTENYVFDDISDQFTGIQSYFDLKVSGSNVTGFSTDNAVILVNNIFQKPQGVQATQADYNIDEKSGVTTVTFTGSGANIGYDANAGDLPRGGIIISVGSTDGFGYQPLVSAGGTAVVSTSGTITSISIGNTGSGYRPGAQSTVNVGVQTFNADGPVIEFIGTAAISGGHIVSVAVTNAGSGYTSTNPPEVVFDEPFSYTNLPLIYDKQTVGVGTNATVDIVVGQGSSVIDFEIKYFGHGYGNGEVLTVGVGGTVGIPTDTTKTFEEFALIVDEVHDDKFNGWSLGVLEVLDSLDDKFNGSKVAFRLTLNGDSFAVRAAKGSNIEVDKTLLVFINEVLQEPEIAYTFSGGSVITFAEPPDAGDKSKILFYKGTGDLDVTFKDILETVKVGDNLEINNNPEKSQGIGLDQDPRVVTGINTVDSVSTNPYVGPGITTDQTLTRPVNWTRQTEDLIINGEKIGKDRVHYEPWIYPTAYLTQPVGVGSTVAYVDTLRPFFDSRNEQSIRTFQDTILITSQDTKTAAAATATVGSAGTVTSLTITNAGAGYTQTPTVYMTHPVGLGTTTAATATASITSGIVTTLTVSGSGGTGYATTLAPSVLIQPPKLINEKISVDAYAGDYGIVVGLGTTYSGLYSTDQLFFDLFIPYDSYMRDADYVGSAITVSGISTADYFVLSDTNISIADTYASLNKTANGTVGIATTFMDCIYQIQQREVYSMPNVSAGIGTTTVGITTDVIRIFVNVDNIGSGFAYTTAPYLGAFSWGKIDLTGRISRESFNSYNTNGVTGIGTAGLVTRYNPLKYKDYIEI